jgi:hypothetical protein
MSIVQRCPNCGTTQATAGECEACHEAHAGPILLHEPRAWRLVVRTRVPSLRRAFDPTSTTASANPAGLTRCPVIPATKPPGSATAKWKENWYDHKNVLVNVHSGADIVIYADASVDRFKAQWIYPTVTAIWRYAKKTYGSMGNNRLYVVLHQNKYSGSHAASQWSASHGHRNLIDVEIGAAAPNNVTLDALTHEVSHIVEGSAHSGYDSPAFPLWGDSKWAEFFLYDFYFATGRKTDAERFRKQVVTHAENFPTAGTYWFHDWFYPNWSQFGHAQFMVRFYSLAGHYLPRDANGYLKKMNWGEYLLFSCAAARLNISSRFKGTFGWNATWSAQYYAARKRYPKVAAAFK